MKEGFVPVTTGQVNGSIFVLRLLYILYFVHTVTHKATGLSASICCLHYWTVQRQTQRPPLKSRDSQDNPRYCIPRSLVPQRCRISTHTSGLVASCGSGWPWCLQIPNRQADHFICLSEGTYVNVCVCAPVKLSFSLFGWGFNSEPHPILTAETWQQTKTRLNPFTYSIFKSQVCPPNQLAYWRAF